MAGAWAPAAWNVGRALLQTDPLPMPAACLLCARAALATSTSPVVPCLYAQADAHPLALLPAPSSPCVVARSLLDKGLEDKVALSRGGPAQLAKLERELKAAKQAVDAAHKAALEPAH